MATAFDGKTQLEQTNRALAPLVAHWLHAYLECSPATQQVVRDMIDIIEDPAAEDDVRQMAVATFLEALFPTFSNGEFGADLEELAQESPDAAAILQQLHQDEATFAERVSALLQARGWTQHDLAAAIGVGQPAISMLLNRSARPQRRTVEKIARAFEVEPGQLWPS